MSRTVPKGSRDLQLKEPKEEEPDWWAELSKATAIHGAPYLVRKDLHWIEKLFWLITIVAAAFYSINSCIVQWERFRDNPLVYQYEYLFALRNFTFMGVTFCAEYEIEEQGDMLINETWGAEIAISSDKFAYYRKFLHILNRLHYNNLEKLEPFENDTSLEHLNYVDLLLQLQRNIMPEQKKSPAMYAASITEMGLCQTTSQLSHYGNPYGTMDHLDVMPTQLCNFFYECQYKHLPVKTGNVQLYLYIHDVNEVMLPNDRHTVFYNAGTQSSFMLKLLLNSITAQKEVENVPVAYRKCRYLHENELKYYKPYHPSLCRQECRIDIALSLCHCKPYFYAAGPPGPICDIKGMLCLARKEWLKPNCNCMPLCTEVSFVLIEEYEQSGSNENQPGGSYKGEQFERAVILKMELPRMGIRRQVVFSTDQLIISFGGAIGLFLGASFMSVYGLIYLFLYFLAFQCKRRCRPKADEQSNNTELQTLRTKINT